MLIDLHFDSVNSCCMSFQLLQALKQVVRNLEICTGQQYEIASLFGCNVKCVYSVAAVTDIIQFIPESWEDSDWKVLAQITPEVTISPTPYTLSPMEISPLCHPKGNYPLLLPIKWIKPMEVVPCIVVSLSDLP